MTESRGTHPLYWSIRAELWENRSLYVAPLLIAGIVLFASLVSMSHLPRRMRTVDTLAPAKQHAAIVSAASMAPAPIMLTTLLVGMFYCLDALYGERRDRSLLFWKSLPVSDTTIVMAKASVPIVILPAIALVLSVIMQLLLLAASTMVLAASGVGAARFWSEFHVLQEPLIMVYGLTVHALWFAPIYAWLLLASAWARRTPFLWAVLPPVVLMIVEHLVWRTRSFAQFLGYRFIGAMHLAFGDVKTGEVIDELTRLTPARFFTSAGLWLGLVFTAAALVTAVRLRRRHGPI